MNYKHLQEIVRIENRPMDYYTKRDNTNFINKLNQQSRITRYKKTVAFTKNISHDRFNI